MHKVSLTRTEIQVIVDDLVEHHVDERPELQTAHRRRRPLVWAEVRWINLLVQWYAQRAGTPIAWSEADHALEKRGWFTVPNPVDREYGPRVWAWVRVRPETLPADLDTPTKLDDLRLRDECGHLRRLRQAEFDRRYGLTEARGPSLQCGTQWLTGSRTGHTRWGSDPGCCGLGHLSAWDHTTWYHLTLPAGRRRVVLLQPYASVGDGAWRELVAWAHARRCEVVDLGRSGWWRENDEAAVWLILEREALTEWQLVRSQS